MTRPAGSTGEPRPGDKWEDLLDVRVSCQACNSADWAGFFADPPVPPRVKGPVRDMCRESAVRLDVLPGLWTVGGRWTTCCVLSRLRCPVYCELWSTTCNGGNAPGCAGRHRLHVHGQCSGSHHRRLRPLCQEPEQRAGMAVCGVVSIDAADDGATIVVPGHGLEVNSLCAHASRRCNKSTRHWTRSTSPWPTPARSSKTSSTRCFRTRRRTA